VATKSKKYTISQKAHNEANEPATSYSTYPSLTIILGGVAKKAMATPTDLDLALLTRNGVQKGSLRNIAAYLGISLDEVSGLLHSSLRNLQRKEDSEPLDAFKSEQVLEIAEFIEQGIKILGSKQAFQQWVQTPLMALGMQTPLHFLDTSFGIRMVHKVLARLQEGVYS
jgi:putative toxin-antitoxin system antitoxin component (TIGR02293 family)